MRAKTVNTAIEVISNPHGIVCFEDLMHEAKKHFETEKNAKNKAYSFILANGLLDKFEEFSKHNNDVNHHDACLEMLKV